MKKFLSLVLTLFISTMVYAVPPQDENGNRPEPPAKQYQNFEKNDNDRMLPEPPQQHKEKMKQDFDKIAKELNITNEQKEQMKQLMESDIAKRKEYKKQIREKMQSIDTELAKEKYDISIIENLTKEIEDIKSKILRIEVDGKIKIRTILTFEQYTKMEQHKKQMMEKFKQDRKK